MLHYHANNLIRKREFAMNKYELPPLPYPYNALEPYIDEQTMRVHHDKHHQAYTDKFNAALSKHPELYDWPVEDLFKNLDNVPDDIRLAVANHGGGYINHDMFWHSLKPEAEDLRSESDLAKTIERDFGGFEQFRKQMTETAINHFGSGWAWLVKDEEGNLKVYSLMNQDTPYSLGDTPLFLIDVWEHAYYLKYQNRRSEFVENIWNVINWEEVEKRFASE